jgi:hypothetical protein
MNRLMKSPLLFSNRFSGVPPVTVPPGPKAVLPLPKV